jgi:sigma-B regulation protein RsbU (phosphoserine phosphatase)
MALGIFEGISVNQRVIQLNYGDYLVFYTDGITEAFSPDEKMYGEERLLEAINHSDFDSARKLAESIDTSVSNFIQEGTPSDDLTMLVLKRQFPHETGEKT